MLKVIIAFSLAAVPGVAAGDARPHLPAPTGEHPVGQTTLHLVDPSRPDPWNPEADKRELLVSLWYPARKATGKAAPYLTPAESALILKDLPVEQKEILAATKTYAKVRAPITKGRHPLVVMSPGFSWPRATLTSLAEDFASRGYLVAAIEHTYESVATTFPGGRTTTCLACVKGQDQAKVAAVRVADVRFTLNRLTAGRWGKAIDPSRIAMVGYSAGGNSTAHALQADKRLKAGVNLDGTFKPYAPALKQPFLLIGNPTSHEPTGKDESWPQSWANLAGWKRWLTFAGSNHASFGDYGVLQPQLGLPGAELGGVRGVELTRKYVGAFLDMHLLGRKTSVLDQPDDPEVRRW
ncbi:alpha/beta hydrolase family protein [Nonomuraea sp. NPDC049400]|uniref:alpha/beta hydrolase family protein n=1 Tax=Nonomuraea sp. NPDC049400 TaxID=3364352 RepID=UPI00379CF8B2